MIVVDTLARPAVLDLIGHTPLLRVGLFDREVPGVEIYAKAEWLNPGGSVKDRAAARMIAEGERSGALRPGKTLLDATSGNTGIAYAMICAALGYRVKLCVPANVTVERKRTLVAYGAELVLTDPMEGSDGAIREARRLYEADPDRYFYPDQYNNDANWRAHYDTTGAEILAQTGGRVTHFVAGLGTSGTFTGVARRLKAELPGVRVISVQPDTALHGVEGLKHMESAIVPGIYDPGLADEDVRVSTEDAHEMVRRLASEQGWLVGVSSGAALAACLSVARRIGRGVIVTIFPDGGTRYLSEPFWDELPPPAATVDIAAGAEQAIRNHARDAYPHECCGALVGTGHAIAEVMPLPNTTEEGPRRRFLVRPSEYREAEAYAGRRGAELLGFYHSHPDHPARPSQYDLDHAWPSFAYVIVAVAGGEPQEMTAWRLKENRSAFVELRFSHPAAGD
jgi:cysteine synthase B